MRECKKYIVLMALAVAVAGLVFVTSADTVTAEGCGKAIEVVEVEITGDGPQEYMFCGADADGEESHATCFKYYWVVPAHPKCVDGSEDWCCRNTQKKAKYYNGKCVPYGQCTYGTEANPPAGQDVPTYLSATLLPCEGGEPHEDCGEFIEGED